MTEQKDNKLTPLDGISVEITSRGINLRTSYLLDVVAVRWLIKILRISVHVLFFLKGLSNDALLDEFPIEEPK